MQDPTYKRLVALEDKLIAAKLEIIRLQKKIDVLATLCQNQIFELTRYERAEAREDTPALFHFLPL